MPGYPIDKIKESVDQWGVDGTIIRKLERGTIEYSMFDHPGLSGSPVFLEDNADDIVAVHTFGTQGNEYGTLGTPITKKFTIGFNQLLIKTRINLIQTIILINLLSNLIQTTILTNQQSNLIQTPTLINP